MHRLTFLILRPTPHYKALVLDFIEIQIAPTKRSFSKRL
jgi:hypothetical protein